MNITKKEYTEMVKKTDPKSPIWKDMLMAFLIGGAICVLGQFLCQICMTNFHLDKKTAGAYVSVILVALSALLTAFDLYSKIAKYAGGGTLVPITGFANSVVAPAIEFKSEGHILGIGAKMFSIAGPVIVFGTISSIVYGIIYYLVNYIK